MVSLDRYRECPEGHFTEMGGDEGLSNFIMETPNLHYGMPGGHRLTSSQTASGSYRYLIKVCLVDWEVPGGARRALVFINIRS
jgi:hypothetical protein